MCTKNSRSNSLGSTQNQNSNLAGHFFSKIFRIFNSIKSPLAHANSYNYTDTQHLNSFSNSHQRLYFSVLAGLNRELSSAFNYLLVKLCDLSQDSSLSNGFHFDAKNATYKTKKSPEKYFQVPKPFKMCAVLFEVALGSFQGQLQTRLQFCSESYFKTFITHKYVAYFATKRTI